MADRKTYTPAQLRYAAFARCKCGAGMAYPKDATLHGSWECSAILTGKPESVAHTAPLPFAFFEVKSEDQPSANGATTRPKESEEEKAERLYRDEYHAAWSEQDAIIKAANALEERRLNLRERVMRLRPEERRIFALGGCVLDQYPEAPDVR